MVKIWNRYNKPQCECTKCSQEDNVERDGFMSIEDQYKNFQRAGINQLEYLKKMFPAGSSATDETINEQGKTLENGINMRKGEELDIIDEARRVEKRTELNNKKAENLKKEREYIEKAMKNDDQ